MFATQNSTEEKFPLQANISRYYMKNTKPFDLNFTLSPLQVIFEPFSVSELMEARQRARIATLRNACQNYFSRSLQCESKEQYIHKTDIFSKKFKVKTSKKIYCNNVR